MEYPFGKKLIHLDEEGLLLENNRILKISFKNKRNSLSHF